MGTKMVWHRLICIPLWLVIRSAYHKQHISRSGKQAGSGYSTDYSTMDNLSIPNLVNHPDHLSVCLSVRLFSSPEPKAQVSYCHSAPSVVICPSVVVCPSVRRKLSHFRLPLKLLNRIQQNLTESKISTPSTKFVFFEPIGKTRWPPWPLIGWDIFDFFSETAERNSTKLDRKQDLNALYQVCVFWADLKNKMAALASDWLRHFWLLLWNHWTEFNKIW